MARLLYILISLILLISCTEENKYITSGVKPAQISGTVRAWTCGIGEPYADSTNPMPFADVTQYKPEFKILYANGTRDSFTIDGDSRFSRYVGPGVFTLIMTNSYSWPPDTLQMSLEGDSTISFNVLRRVLDPDTLIVTLSSVWSLDTARPRREWETIGKLSEAIGGGLKMPSSEPIMAWRTVSESGGEFHLRWTIPVAAPHYNVSRIYDLAIATIAADSVRFGNLSVWANGFYDCGIPIATAKIEDDVTEIAEGRAGSW